VARAPQHSAHGCVTPSWRPIGSGILGATEVALHRSTGFGRGVVQLTGSVVENPHGLHWNTFKFSAKARLIMCSKIIGRPQMGQMTSFALVTLIADV
jgi:hypothetical protein